MNVSIWRSRGREGYEGRKRKEGKRGSKKTHQVVVQVHKKIYKWFEERQWLPLDLNNQCQSDHTFQISLLWKLIKNGLKLWGKWPTFQPLFRCTTENYRKTSCQISEINQLNILLIEDLNVPSTNEGEGKGGKDFNIFQVVWKRERGKVRPVNTTE